MWKRWIVVLAIALFASLLVALASLRFEQPSGAGRQAGPATEPSRPQSAVAQQPSDSDIEALIDQLASRDSAATRSAARKLEKIGSRAVPLLIRRLEKTSGGGQSFNKLRWWCVNVLGNIKDKRATPVLVQCAAKDKDPHTRWRSIWALNVIGDKRRIALLRERLKSQDELERFNAATALSTMGVDDGVAVIEDATRSHDRWLRWQAVSALGRIKSPRTLKILVECLKDPVDSIRQEAAMALGRLGDPKAVPALLDALKDAKPGVRWRAARSLGELNATDAIPALLKLLDDSDGSVKSQAAVSLGKMGVRDRILARKVIEMLFDPSKEVRSRAATTVGLVCSPEDIKRVQEALKREKEEFVRRKLKRSLEALRSRARSSKARRDE